MMKYNNMSICCLCCILVLLCPYSSEAQPQNATIQRLTVSLWPEYDQPDVLVIYHVQLRDDVALPAQVTFRLPEYLENLYAIAVEADGRLVNVDRNLVEFTRDETHRVLTFPVSSRKLQFEYYDSVILAQQDHTRRITYTFSPQLPVETAVFEVQHPTQSEDVILTPASTDTYTGRDGLTYSKVDAPNLSPGETFELSATYWRTTSALSVQKPQAPQTTAPQTTAPQPTTTPTTTGSTEDGGSLFYAIFYMMIGAGMASLVWWWGRSIGRIAARQDVVCPQCGEVVRSGTPPNEPEEEEQAA